MTATAFMRREWSTLKTAESNNTAVREIVQGILNDVEKRGEEAIQELARRFDGWEGELILSDEKKKRLIDSVPENLKKDIRFSFEQVRNFAKAQKDSLKAFETELP